MFSTVKNLDLPAFSEIPNLDFYLKNGLLFGIYEEKPHACIRENPDANMLNALSHLGGKYPLLVLDEESYDKLKNRFLEARSEEGIGEVEGFETPEEIENFLQNEDLLNSENSAPIIRYVNSLFVQAVKRRATDIHIETFEKEGDVRFRIDGVLNKIATLKRGAIESIINRIKVISNLDISETRIPQDGRTKVTIAGSGVDVRVSILPTYYGEKVVMRLLMKGESIPSLHNLGFSVEIYNKLKSLLKHSYGMILITGPTGSGKSTTLHSFLKEIDHEHFNIVTIENPVEYNAPGVNQIQVNEKVNLTFSEALRSILRQDPDVIMVGEMRDKETAKIATQAAMTGHLLLSTLHTNSAVAAIPRLFDMGIDPFLVRSTLIGILAQRLVRKLCPYCKVAYAPSEDDIEYFYLESDTKVYGPKGCKKCGFTGYRGRRAIGEIILVDDAFGAKIKYGADEQTLRNYLIEETDFRPMFEELRSMVISGETSISEAIRIGVKGV
ncbi:GspE/PulE family protein [Hydrogenimonas urashimensis]|uniref:GspE/PulE family protein n=1 Tax=Hydrogenimonas urashimensis TaxID=2740515 RepID=UPI00191518AF|nr:GspE/PulE family protein [Hydrogenimonas urashimensis]